MDRGDAVMIWREICGSEEVAGLPPTGRLLEKFADRIEALEREACLAACEDEMVDEAATGSEEDRAYNDALSHAAAVIRAR